jgi:hypothetical protein
LPGHGETPGKQAVSDYHSDGGLLGLISDRVAARWVGRSLEESLKNLRRFVEA